MTSLLAIAAAFRLPAPPASIETFPGGHIHRAWRLTDQQGRRYLLQRLNTRVFPDPEAVMANVAAVCRHLRRRAAFTSRHVLCFRPVRGRDAWLHRTRDGAVYRLCDFVEDSVSLASPRGPADATAAGLAFGRFVAALADYPAVELITTLPGFHATRRRFASLLVAIVQDPLDRAAACADTIAEARRLAEHGHRLVPRRLPVRVVHNDAKLANVLLDVQTGAPLCVIDLDTVMPGTPLHDFGDLVRTVATTAPEDATDLARVGLDLDGFQALVGGYLEGCGDLLTPAERAGLVDGGLAITFEQAVRFLDDHLRGDLYYPVTHPGQNLARARNQLALLRALAAADADLRAIVNRAGS